MTPATPPRATYRVQVHSGFTMEDLRGILPHLERLGVSHVHVSPLTAARTGSTHGYDVVDPSRLGDELGGAAAFEALVRDLRAHGLGLILDVVPNHEAAHHLNARWQDVMRHGACSEHARRYDIDWDRGRGQVLRPLLGRAFGRALEDGEISVAAAEDELVARAADAELPLDPRTWSAALGEPAGGEIPEITRAIDAITLASREIPPRSDLSPQALCWRRERCVVLRSRLRALLSDPAGRAAVAARLGRLAGSPGNPASFDALEALLRDQAWRLTSWTAGTEDLNYRRFFDITDLVGVRVEDPVVFEATHELVLSLAARGAVQGLRIDHVDGLREPRAYLERLAKRLLEATGGVRLPVVVEKILAADEAIPSDWHVFGTTGYETLNAITGALVDPAGLARLQSLYASRTGRTRSPRQVCARRKSQVMRELLRGEERLLVGALHELALADRHACDVARSDLREMLGALTAALPAYRTYREPGRELSASDRLLLERGIRDASSLVRTDAQRRALAFLGSVLLAPVCGADHPRARFVLRWQQYTGPVMAKGLEDTAFYVHVPLLAANEVGGDVGGGAAFAGADAFHARMAGLLAAGRPGLAPTSTHDTKRGEDARARLALLTDVPGRWDEVMGSWERHDVPWRRLVRGRMVPDANERELLAQSLLGCWPLERNGDWRHDLLARFTSFVTKAVREAKTNSSWLEPDAASESALHGYVKDLLERLDAEPLASFAAFADEVAHAALVASIAQVLLRNACPGVPEVYQGSQGMNLSLVDPDNRRPVDHAALDDALLGMHARLREGDAPSLVRGLLDSRDGSSAKLFVTWATLQARARDPALFAAGSHVPLKLELLPGDDLGARALAFARALPDRAAIVLVPTGILGPAWRGRRPIPGAWSGAAIRVPEDLPLDYADAITGRAISVRGGLLDPLEAWQDAPVALLISH